MFIYPSPSSFPTPFERGTRQRKQTSFRRRTRVPLARRRRRSERPRDHPSISIYTEKRPRRYSNYKGSLRGLLPSAFSWIYGIFWIGPTTFDRQFNTLPHRYSTAVYRRLVARTNRAFKNVRLAYHADDTSFRYHFGPIVDYFCINFFPRTKRLPFFARPRDRQNMVDCQLCTVFLAPFV